MTNPNLYVLPNLTLEQYNLVVKHCTPWGQDFMASVYRQFREKGRLSEKQGALLDKVSREALDKAAGKSAPRAAQASEPSFTKITEMFDKAAEQLKRPRVMFAADGIGEFMVRRAGDESRNPGFLYVVFEGDYVGKIEPQAKGARFYATRECPKAVTQALESFNKDPQKAALAYGQATGNCCFCARELTDARSVEVGYGPICADRYGLPWGD